MNRSRNAPDALTAQLAPYRAALDSSVPVHDVIASAFVNPLSSMELVASSVLFENGTELLLPLEFIGSVWLLGRPVQLMDEVVVGHLVAQGEQQSSAIVLPFDEQTRRASIRTNHWFNPSANAQRLQPDYSAPSERALPGYNMSAAMRRRLQVQSTWTNYTALIHHARAAAGWNGSCAAETSHAFSSVLDARLTMFGFNSILSQRQAGDICALRVREEILHQPETIPMIACRPQQLNCGWSTARNTVVNGSAVRTPSAVTQAKCAVAPVTVVCRTLPCVSARPLFGAMYVPSCVCYHSLSLIDALQHSECAASDGIGHHIGTRKRDEYPSSERGFMWHKFSRQSRHSACATGRCQHDCAGVGTWHCNYSVRAAEPEQDSPTRLP